MFWVRFYNGIAVVIYRYGHPADVLRGVFEFDACGTFVHEHGHIHVWLRWSDEPNAFVGSSH